MNVPSVFLTIEYQKLIIFYLRIIHQFSLGMGAKIGRIIYEKLPFFYIGFKIHINLIRVKREVMFDFLSPTYIQYVVTITHITFIQSFGSITQNG